MYIENKLRWLNASNQTAKYQVGLVEQLMIQFPKDKIVVLEVGSAFGGAVEFIAKLLKSVSSDRGVVYGYDTFTGHPKDLAITPDNEEAHAMDIWYDKPLFIPETLTYKYQRNWLDHEGLTNAFLVKGRVNKHSFDDIKTAHLVMLDMDLVKPTQIAYDALKDKVVRNGYMLIHDAVPTTHIPQLHDFVFNEVVKDGRWTIEKVADHDYIVSLKRI